MIGVEPDASFEVDRVRVEPGGRLYVYSDGVFEVPRDGRGRMLGQDGFSRLAAARSGEPDDRVGRLLDDMRGYHGSAEFGDDFSLIELTFA